MVMQHKHDEYDAELSELLQQLGIEQLLEHMKVSPLEVTCVLRQGSLKEEYTYRGIDPQQEDRLISLVILCLHTRGHVDGDWIGLRYAFDGFIPADIPWDTRVTGEFIGQGLIDMINDLLDDRNLLAKEEAELRLERRVEAQAMEMAEHMTRMKELAAHEARMAEAVERQERANEVAEEMGLGKYFDNPRPSNAPPRPVALRQMHDEDKEYGYLN